MNITQVKTVLHYYIYANRDLGRKKLIFKCLGYIDCLYDCNKINYDVYLYFDINQLNSMIDFE